MENIQKGGEVVGKGLKTRQLIKRMPGEQGRRITRPMTMDYDPVQYGTMVNPFLCNMDNQQVMHGHVETYENEELPVHGFYPHQNQQQFVLNLRIKRVNEKQERTGKYHRSKPNSGLSYYHR